MKKIIILILIGLTSNITVPANQQPPSPFGFGSTEDFICPYCGTDEYYGQAGLQSHMTRCPHNPHNQLPATPGFYFRAPQSRQLLQTPPSSSRSSSTPRRSQLQNLPHYDCNLCTFTTPNKTLFDVHCSSHTQQNAIIAQNPLHEHSHDNVSSFHLGGDPCDLMSQLPPSLTEQPPSSFHFGKIDDLVTELPEDELDELICFYCNTEYCPQVGLEQHLSVCSKNPDNQQPDLPQTFPQYPLLHNQATAASAANSAAAMQLHQFQPPQTLTDQRPITRTNIAQTYNLRDQTLLPHSTSSTPILPTPPEEPVILVCPPCNFSTSDVISFEQHMLQHSQIEQNTNTAYDDEQPSQVQEQVLQPEPAVASTETFLCLICPGKQNLQSEKALQKHSTEKHPQLAYNPNDYKHICYLCKRPTKTKSQLEMHINAHKNIRLFSCELCDKSFTHKTTLDNHLKTHLAINSKETLETFLCLICHGKQNLKSEEALQKHNTEKHPQLADNPNDYKHICYLCKKPTINKLHLEMHINAHKNIRPFSCALCQKPFTHKGTLKHHFRNAHTKEPNTGNQEKYVCTLCGENFEKTKRSVSEHFVKTHLKKKKFSRFTDDDLSQLKIFYKDTTGMEYDENL